jgi:ABC-type multidrug transport system ATPase subunit
VFAPLTATFERPQSYAILGANGSGKSTLLRMMAGMQSVSTGRIYCEKDGTAISPEIWHKQVALCAPGMELVEELTLRESVDFHFRFKSFLPGMNAQTVIEATGLQRSKDKMLADFSSGMTQRVKLALAIFSDTPVLLLDEPCTNLDDAGVAQYRDWVKTFSRDRLVIVASNDAREYDFCDSYLQLTVSAEPTVARL